MSMPRLHDTNRLNITEVGPGGTTAEGGKKYNWKLIMGSLFGNLINAMYFSLH